MSIKFSLSIPTIDQWEKSVAVQKIDELYKMSSNRSKIVAFKEVTIHKCGLFPLLCPQILVQRKNKRGRETMKRWTIITYCQDLFLFTLSCFFLLRKLKIDHLISFLTIDYLVLSFMKEVDK